jgi:type II secretory pathway pseudopilin PulG
MSAVAIPSLRNLISSQRLQSVAWQMVQDLRTVRADAILYQQDLNAYINFNNSPVGSYSASNINNRSYLFETFQWGQDQASQVSDQHYIPTDASGNHFTQRVLQYGIFIDSIASATSVLIPSTGGEKYCVMCFRSGAGSAFRGEGDLVSLMDTTNIRKNSTPNTNMIGTAKLVIKLKDPSTSKVFYVIVDGTGKTSMYGSPPS